jgi:hypothetical protein
MTRKRKTRQAHTKNLPLRVSLLCLSTALCVARLSAVLARRLALRLTVPSGWAAALPVVAVVVVVLGGDAVGDPVGDRGVVGGGADDAAPVLDVGDGIEMETAIIHCE